MLATLSLISLVIAPLAASQVPASDTLIAMTRSGLRLEVLEQPSVGSREFSTPYGRFFSPLDPVAVVLHTQRTQRWRAELEIDPTLSLAQVVENLAADGRIEELLEMVELLDDLYAHSEGELAEQRAKELVQASTELRKWGARLDPLPKKLSGKERSEWLWKKFEKAKGAEALLLGGRLLEEVAPGSGGLGERTIRYSDLKRALKHKNPFLLSVVALISAKQNMVDAVLGALMLEQSIEHDHPFVRHSYAYGVAELWPNYALLYWMEVLMRSEDSKRIRALWHIVDNFREKSKDPLAVALAGYGQSLGRRIQIGDLYLTVVIDRRNRVANPLAALASAGGNGLGGSAPPTVPGAGNL
jgi:hypothetical protein